MNIFASDALDVVSGHLYYYHIKDYVKDFKKVTFLREPVARVLSEHRYVFERDHRHPSKVLAEHFLPTQGDPLDTAANVACRCLSQLDPLDPSISIEQHLESAKATLLNEFDFVGITEEMEESTTLFYQLLGWKPPEEIATHNTTPVKRSPGPVALLQAIAERNWADIALYQFAREIFALEKERIVPWRQDEQIQWVDHLEYCFQGPLDGFGWCPRERWAEGTFRWLWSSERGCIEFPLISGYNYVLKADLYLQSALVSKLKIWVNGRLRPHSLDARHQSHAGYQWYTCSVTIPASFLRAREKTRIEIEICDPQRRPATDSYRGRCGSKKISIQRA